jgi:hypothetical protein
LNLEVGYDDRLTSDIESTKAISALILIGMPGFDRQLAVCTAGSGSPTSTSR